MGQTAGFDRLVVVLLHREHTYGDLEAVKDELSGKVLELAPPGLGDNKQVGVGLQRWEDRGNEKSTSQKKSLCGFPGGFPQRLENLENESGHGKVMKHEKIAKKII